MRAPNLKDVPIEGTYPDIKEVLNWIESLTLVTRQQLNRAALIVDTLVGEIEDSPSVIDDPKELVRVAKALRSARNHLDCARRHWLFPELKKQGMGRVQKPDPDEKAVRQ